MAPFTQEEQKTLLNAFREFDKIERDPKVHEHVMRSARVSSALRSSDLDLILK